MSDPLQHFSEADRAFLIRLISLVIDKPQGHSISMRRAAPGHGSDAYEYWISFDDGAPLNAPNPIPYSANVFRPLPPMSFARPHPRNQEMFHFTDQAFHWYREVTAPTDQQIQQSIARELIKTVHANPYNYAFEQTDLKPLADRLQVPLERIVQNAHTLVHIGKAQGPQELRGGGVEDGWVSLTPDGIEWVNSNFIDRNVAQVNVNLAVNLNLSISALITQVNQLQIPSELKNLLESQLAEFESDPTLSRFAEIMSLGSDIATFGQAAAMLSPFLYNFVTANADYLLSLFKLPSFLFR